MRQSKTSRTQIFLLFDKSGNRGQFRLFDYAFAQEEATNPLRSQCFAQRLGQSCRGGEEAQGGKNPSLSVSHGMTLYFDTSGSMLDHH